MLNDWNDAYEKKGPRYSYEDFYKLSDRGSWYGFGFFYLDFPDGPGGPASVSCELYLPCWFLVAVTVLLPLYPLYARIRTRRGVPGGFCAKCGYDLRATPERCPECGTIPTNG
jgi:hypothetical protein